MNNENININNINITEDNILMDFLDHAVNKAKDNLAKNGRLEVEDAIPLMLKSQFNHIAHLEAEMVTKTEFKAQFEGLRNEFNYKFSGLKEEVKNIKWLIMFSLAFMSILIMIVPFVQKIYIS